MGVAGNENFTFEDRYSPVMRRVMRTVRAVRWRVKGALGIPRTVLVEMDWRLGDEIMALPVYEAMRDAWPDAVVVVVTGYPELFEGMDGVVAVGREDRGDAGRSPHPNPLPRGEGAGGALTREEDRTPHPNPLPEAGRGNRREDATRPNALPEAGRGDRTADVAEAASGDSRAAVVSGEVSRALVSPDRYVFLRDASRTEFRLAHYARLAGVEAPRARPKVVVGEAPSPLVGSLPGTEQNRVALAAGTTWETKTWAAENWRALAGELSEAGYVPVELGAGHAAVSGAHSLVDKTSVVEAACVLRACRLLVCSDSGLMHLALAVGTPVVALFGPTDASILIRDEPNLQVITNERPCQGCWNISLAMTEPGVCPLDIPDCLGTIAVERVLQAVRAAAPLDA